MSKTAAASVAEARTWYPVTERCIYMDVSNQGVTSLATRNSFQAHLDKRMNGDNDELELLGLVEKLRERYARFINAETDEIAMVKSASEALGLTASAFLWKPGDNVVICADVEHGNNVYPWLNLKERYGIEVRTVPARESHIPVEAMIKAIDARTRVLTASTVTTSPGFRVDAAALGKACRERGVFYLLDGAQTAGIMHTDVKAMYADAFACSTVKGLMGLYGMGFLYMRKEWAERLTPPYIARFSVDLGDLPEAAMTGLNYRLRDGAKRFDAGHYNFPGAIAVYNSLGELGSVGTQAIEAHVVGLARRLAQGLLDLGIPVAGGAPGPHTASIVSVGISKPGFFSEASAPAFAELADQLTKNNVIFSIRRGLIRFSLHLYNTEAEIDRVIEIAKAWKSKARRA